MNPPATSPTSTPTGPKLEKTYWGKTPVDLHLLPGLTSKSYLDILRATIDGKECKGGDGGSPMAFANGIAALFWPMVADGDLGITCDFLTGVITVKDLPYGPWNFIVEVPFYEVEGILPKDWKRLDATFTRYYRVHVHRKVTQIAATPNPMTIRVGEEPKVRLLATFDDDSMGDITYADLDWEFKSGKSCFSGWTAVSTGTAELEATFRDFVPSDGSKTSLTIHIEKSWKDLGASTELTLIRQKGQSTGWHILFLPEGWQPDAKSDYVAKVVKLTETVFQTDAFKAWKLCQDSITCWLSWIPSPPNGGFGNPGVTSYGEYIEFDSDRLVRVPTPTPPGASVTSVGPSRCVRSDVLFRVGLPVKDDRKRDPGELRQRWLKLYGVPIDESKGIDLAFTLFKRRYLVAKADSAFDTSFDGPCAVELSPADQSAHSGFDLEVGNSDGLSDFLQALAEHKWSSAEKTLWTEMDGRRRRGIVVLVTATVPDIRADAGNFAEVDLESPFLDSGLDLNPPRMQVDFSKLALDLPAEECSIFAHEIGHGFGLGDEYTEFSGSPDATGIKNIASYPNLAYLASSETKDKSTKGFAKLGKWMDWHRIEFACHIGEGEPVPGGLPGEVRLNLNTGGVIKGDDIVYLRTRPLATSKVFGPLAVLPPQDIDFFNSVRVLLIEDWDPELFRNAIIYRPKTQLLGGKHVPLTIVSDVVRKTIVETRNLPLNLPMAGSTPGKCVEDWRDVSVTWPNFDPLNWPFHDSDIVGIYSSGYRYTCDVYRPSATCMMRDSHSMRPFCFVCQYALVDAIDPVKHPALDRLYEDNYPTNLKKLW